MYQTILKVSLILITVQGILNCAGKDTVHTTDDMPLILLNKHDSYKYESIIKIEIGNSMCSGVVISDNYALTAAHCVESSWEGLTSTPILVYDQQSNITDVVAQAAAMDTQRDIALITGDFKAFKPRPVDWSGSIELTSGDQLVSCGFPAGQIDLYCTKETYYSHAGFQHLMYGSPIFKGCSGGPVFNSKGWVIGVNSAVAANYLYVGPVIGFLAEVGLEKRRKH